MLESNNETCAGYECLFIPKLSDVMTLILSFLRGAASKSAGRKLNGNGTLHFPLLHSTRD